MKPKMLYVSLVAMLWVGMALSLSGCEGKEARRNAYFEKGKSLYEAGDDARARLELKNALQIDNKYAEAWFLLGRVDERRGDFGKAYADYSRAVELAPDMLDARVRKALLLLSANRLDAAEPEIDAALAQAPDNADALAARASLRWRRGDPAAAEHDARAALSRDRAHVGASLLLATLQMDQEEFKEAEQILQRGIDAHPDAAPLRLALGRVYEAQGNLEGVQDVLQGLIAQYPETFAYRLRLAQFHAAHKRIDEAENVLRDALGAAPDDAVRQQALVEFLAQARGIDSAKTELATMLARQPDAASLRFVQADLLIKGGDTAAAEAVYREIIDRAQGTGPDAIKARNTLAQWLMGQKRDSEAATLIEAVLAESPREPDALQLRAVLALRQQDAAQAIADLRSVLRDYPERVAAQRLLGQAHAMQGEYPLAQDALEKAIGMAPADPQAYLLLADVQTRTGNMEGAQATLEGLLQKVPDSAAAQQAIATIQMSERDWQGLAEHARRIKESHPEHPLGYYLEGLALQQQGQHAEAVAAFDKALELKPGAAEPLIALARSQLALGAPEKAQQRVTQVLNDQPNNLVALNLLGDIYLRTGALDKAATTFNEAVRLHPKSPRAYLRLAQVQVAQGSQAMARETLERGVAETDRNGFLVMELANLLGQMGERAAAIAAYEDVITRYPKALAAVNNLAMLLATDAADPEELDRALELAGRLKGSRLPAFNDTVGWVHYLRGEYADALPFLEQAVAGNRDLPELRYHLGMNYLKLGRTEEAREHLSAAAAATNFAQRGEAQKVLATLNQAG